MLRGYPFVPSVSSICTALEPRACIYPVSGDAHANYLSRRRRLCPGSEMAELMHVLQKGSPTQLNKSRLTCGAARGRKKRLNTCRGEGGREERRKSRTTHPAFGKDTRC